MSRFPPSVATQSPLQVDVTRNVRTRSPSISTLRVWATAALGSHADGSELSIRIVSPAESRRLNARYRQKNHPTNVLSFPAPPPLSSPLGDLVICPQVLRAEARAQHKPLRAHWAHLIVHGALHLIGYDHERPADARRMERREIAVLRRLGFPNPYSSVREVSPACPRI